MPESTPNYKAEIALLIEMFLDLYAREIGTRTCLINRGVVASGDLNHYIREAGKDLAGLPEVRNLRKEVDQQTLAGLLQVIQDARE